MSKRKWKKSLNIVLSASLLAGLGISAVPSSAGAATNAADLIISEYIKGSSNNKALELYNGTGEEVDLNLYTLENYANGATTKPSTLKLSGKLKNNTTYVIYKGSWLEC